MDKKMAKTKLTFTYDIQDDYCSGTFDLKRSAQYTYEGPDKIWIFVHNETGEIQNMNWFSQEEDGPNLEAPLGYTNVEIDCSANPLACELIGSNQYDWDRTQQEMNSIDLPNGDTYTYPKYPEPNHTYSTEDIKYNIDTGTFTYNNFEGWRTWEEIEDLVKNKLKRVDEQLTRINDFPESLLTALTEYKNTLDTFLVDWADIPPQGVNVPVNPIDNS